MFAVLVALKSSCPKENREDGQFQLKRRGVKGGGGPKELQRRRLEHIVFRVSIKLESRFHAMVLDRFGETALRGCFSSPRRNLVGWCGATNKI
jgi:hypothetical protein